MPDDDRAEQIRARLAAARIDWTPKHEGLWGGATVELQRNAPADLAWLLAERDRLATLALDLQASSDAWMDRAERSQAHLVAVTLAELDLQGKVTQIGALPDRWEQEAADGGYADGMFNAAGDLGAALANQPEQKS